MPDLSLDRLSSADPRLKSLESLYHASFPDYEAKPFEMIIDGTENGLMDSYVLMISQEDKKVPAALAFVILGKKITLLDYLAVDPAYQSYGLGSYILSKLSEVYEKPLVVEIESTEEKETEAEEQLQRERRKQFYLKNGFLDSGVRISLFGVNMELLSSRLRIDYDDYADTIFAYLNHYSVNAEDNVFCLSKNGED